MQHKAGQHLLFREYTSPSYLLRIFVGEPKWEHAQPRPEGPTSF